MSKGYETGYKKPPKKTQFKKGSSGNPKGRLKGTKNLKTDLEEELRELINLKEGGKEKRVSKQRALIKALLAKAVKGEPRAASLLFAMMLKLMQVDETPPEFEKLSVSDKQILARFEQEVLKASKKGKGKPHAR